MIWQKNLTEERNVNGDDVAKQGGPQLQNESQSCQPNEGGRSISGEAELQNSLSVVHQNIHAAKGQMVKAENQQSTGPWCLSPLQADLCNSQQTV